jgi:hypothetical protein
MRVHLAALAIVLSASVATAQEDLKRQLLNCASIDGQIRRLDCYDAVVAEMTDPGTRRKADEWEVQTKSNPMDDSAIVILGLRGLERRADLVVGCREKALYVLVAPRGEILSLHGAMVRTRLGKGRAEKKRWRISSDQKSAIYPGSAKAFIQALLAEERLAVEVEVSLGGTVGDVFDIHRLKEAIGPLKAQCSVE